jgi:hypothetical protein
METKLLFPNRFKKIGWVLLVPGLVLSIYSIILMVIPETIKPQNTLFTHFSFFEEHHIFSKWTTITGFTIAHIQSGFQMEDMMGEILMTFAAIGFLFVAFSREKIEDEWIAKIRIESLVWSFYLFILVLLLVIWFAYSFSFVLYLALSLLILPIVFLLRFNWLVYLKPYFESRKEAKL